MGIDMMNREMQAASLPQPIYEDTGASFIVTLIGPGEKWMAKREAGLPEGLNERQKKAIEYLQTHQTLTRREYCEFTNTSPRTAHRDLADLVKRGLLRSVGKGRSSRYILVEG